MHITIRKYRGCKDANEVNRLAVAELLPVLRKIAGFCSYQIVDSGNGTVTSIGVFDSAAASDNANLQARAVVQASALKALLPNPPDITVGEVLSEAK